MGECYGLFLGDWRDFVVGEGGGGVEQAKAGGGGDWGVGQCCVLCDEGRWIGGHAAVGVGVRSVREGRTGEERIRGEDNGKWGRPMETMYWIRRLAAHLA